MFGEATIMKLDLEVDTEKLNDEQLEKLRVFLISVGMWKDQLGSKNLKIPPAWKDNPKALKWWMKLHFPFPRMGPKK